MSYTARAISTDPADSLVDAYSSSGRHCELRRDSPVHWFNEDQNPAFNIGPYAFPAFVLPLCVSLGYVFYLRYGLPAVERPVRAGFGAPADHEAAREGPDENVPGNPRTRWIEFAWDFMGVQSAGYALRLERQPMFLELTTFAYIMGTGMLLRAIFDSSLSRRVYIIGGLGWLTFANRDRNPNLTVASLVLAVPCLLPIGRRSTGTLIAGIALIVVSLDRLPIPLGQFLLWKHDHPYWRYIVTALLIAFSSLAESARPLTATKLGRGLSELALLSLQIALFMLTIAANVVISSFCVACIGWKNLLFGRPATHPIETIHCLWFSDCHWLPMWPVILPMLMLIWAWQRRLRPRSMRFAETWESFRLIKMFGQLSTWLEATGMTVLLLTGLWLFLLSVTWLDGSGQRHDLCLAEVEST